MKPVLYNVLLKNTECCGVILDSCLFGWLWVSSFDPWFPQLLPQKYITKPLCFCGVRIICKALDKSMCSINHVPQPFPFILRMWPFERLLATGGG